MPSTTITIRTDSELAEKIASLDNGEGVPHEQVMAEVLPGEKDASR